MSKFVLVVILNLFSFAAISEENDLNLNFQYCASDTSCSESEYKELFRKVAINEDLLCKADSYVPLYHDTYLLWVCESMPSFSISIVSFEEEEKLPSLVPNFMGEANCKVDINSKYAKGSFKPLAVSSDITQVELLGCLVLWHFSHEFDDKSICSDDNSRLLFRMSETLFDLPRLLRGSENSDLYAEADEFSVRFSDYEKLVGKHCYLINDNASRFFNADW